MLQKVGPGGRIYRQGLRANWSVLQSASVNAPVVALTANSASPQAVRQVIVKINSRCNLSCTYCYVYNSVDAGWRSQPKSMDLGIIQLVAQRIAEHLDRHRLESVDVILHGGEPLLAGHDRIESMLTTVRRAMRPPATVRFLVQT